MNDLMNNASIVMTFMQRGWTDKQAMSDWLDQHTNLSFNQILASIPSLNGSLETTNFGEHTRPVTPIAQPIHPVTLVQDDKYKVKAYAKKGLSIILTLLIIALIILVVIIAINIMTSTADMIGTVADASSELIDQCSKATPGELFDAGKNFLTDAFTFNFGHMFEMWQSGMNMVQNH